MTEIERLKEEVERLIAENKRCFGMGRGVGGGVPHGLCGGNCSFVFLG